MTDAFGIPKNPADRGFGDIEHRKHAALQDQSLAMHEAARNLLHKAVAALEVADTDKALTYVRKAERLPYDDYGGASPLSLAAHMYALESVLDVFEAGDEVWLDAAEVLHDETKTRTPLALADFRHVLTVVQHDYETSPGEDRQLRSLIAGQQVATIREMQELAGEELCAVVMDLLDIVIDYNDEAEVIFEEHRMDDDY
ncbi:MAG TPA: hypothetical protein VG502_07065 [Flexivirga sp.]|uniref:hypothetical protein n=1 Tax=Flexivirga sp. TaxID=1962927 RepID=UPI002CDFA5EC|nr:hypothetical protein [Flexivirga sp.]HWC22045.1 hypothetical protein [Flexivirga sp.]